MLRMLFRKIARSRWLVFCLLAGSIVGVSMVASIPLYTNGILQRMLSRDLEGIQERTGEFPGRYTLQAEFFAYSSGSTNVTDFPQYDATVHSRLVPDLGVPVLAQVNRLSCDYLQAAPSPGQRIEPRTTLVKLEALSDAEQHLRITQGRMFSSAGGELEVVVSEIAYERLGVRLDTLYDVSEVRGHLKEPLRVRVVGIYTIGDPQDLWWYSGSVGPGDVLLAPYDRLRAIATDASTPLLTRSEWSVALDYHAVTVAQLQPLLRTIEGQLRLFGGAGISYGIPMLETLRQYRQREQQLLVTLAFLQVPVLIMLAFFVFMVGQLIIEADRNEIAVLKSRGARSRQVFLVYLVESGLFAAIALLAGPPLALVVCRAIGAADGFLQFVQRPALRVGLSLQPYLWAALCAGLLMLTLLVPAYRASRTTIVVHKQRLSREPRPPVWKRAFLDAALLLLAGYGYYAYHSRQSVLQITGVSAGSLSLDPLLFLISTAFLIGSGLLFVRLYPLALRLVFRLGRAVWPPWLYATLLSVARSGGQEQFLMLFLILTLSIGVFNAKAARTINRNVEDAIAYGNGAEIVLQENWPATDALTGAPVSSPLLGGPPSTDPQAEQERAVEYHEPDFQPFTTLKGVELATKVLREPRATVRLIDGQTMDATLMGIIPSEFGQVAWFRPGLLPHHWNEYLNLLGESPQAALVSQSFADRHKVSVGDTVLVSWGGQGFVEVVVYAFVPWWPTYRPYPGQSGEPTELVVANLDWIQAQSALEPYEVWLKKNPGVSSEEVYRELESLSLPIVSLTDSSQLLVGARNDPLLQGTNGALTLGFLVTVLVSTIGFLIYWIISLQGRLMRFGVFRAMGLSRGSVLGILIGEQVLVSLVGTLVGITVGGVASDLFVPLLELTKNAAQQVPPFLIVADRADYVRLYATVAVMLGLALTVLAARILRLNVARALKLGEE